MAVTEKNRIKLHDSLTRAIGEEEADTLMESLPPDKWHELATTTDLKNLESRICNELSKLRVDTNNQITDLKNDTARQFSEVNRQFSEVNRQFAEVNAHISDHKNETAKQFVEVKNQISDLGNQISELKGLIVNHTADSKLIAVDQSRTFILWVAAFAIAVCLTVAGGVYFN